MMMCPSRGKSPKSSRPFDQRYFHRGIDGVSEKPYHILTPIKLLAILQRSKIHLNSLFPLAPYKKASLLAGRVRMLVGKHRRLVYDTKRALARYPFRVRCKGRCRFHKRDAVCFPFKRLCWSHVHKRPFFGADQPQLQNGVAFWDLLDRGVQWHR
jgi:hypothetical protein